MLLWVNLSAESLYSGMEEFVAQARALTKESIVEVEGAASAGKPDAQVVLGFAYLEGIGGLSINMREAAKLFESAAAHGHVCGQLMIATLYLEGQGVERDMLVAKKWLERAAQQNNPEAFYMLGNISYLGEAGAQRSLVDAHKWFTLAIYSTTNVSKKRVYEQSAKLVEKDMKPEELDSSRKLVNQWQAERHHN